MKKLNKTILKSISKPKLDSHKGQNGRVLVIAGSEKFHGAMFLAIESASRVVDMVYVHSTEENLNLIKKLKNKISVFIGVNKKELWKTVELVDAILIGPGLPENKNTINLLKKLLTKYPDKKIVIDATALWHLNLNWLNKNCVCVPHSREFKKAFNCEPIPENVFKSARENNCLIVLKGKFDYISNGKELWENRTGNPGMTKGGTGDVMSGLITALASQNDLLTAVLAGTYLSGLAGDNLKKKVGYFYNAEDLIEELGGIFSRMV